MTFLSAPVTSGNLLPTTGQFALKNIGTGETVGVESDQYLKSGLCVEVGGKMLYFFTEQRVSKSATLSN